MKTKKDFEGTQFVNLIAKVDACGFIEQGGCVGLHTKRELLHAREVQHLGRAPSTKGVLRQGVV